MNTTMAFSQIKDTFQIIAAQTQEHSKSISAMTCDVQKLVSFAETLSTNVDSLVKDGARIANDMNDIRTETRTSLDAMRVEIRDLKNKKPSMTRDQTALRHFALHYLMRVGMDTRLGYVCAVPVKDLHKGVFVAISLNLLTTSFGRFFKAQKNTGMTIAAFQAAFKSRAEEKLRVVQAAMKIMGFREKKCTSAESSKWVVLSAPDFISMCKDAEKEGEEEWAGLSAVVDTKDDKWDKRGFTFLRQTNCVYEDDNETPEDKLSWGVKAAGSILSSEHMKAYRALLDGGSGSNKPIHFTAHRVFSTEVEKRGPGFVAPVGKRPRSGATPPHTGKRPRYAVNVPTKGDRSPSGGESDSDSSGDGSDDSSDDSTEEDEGGNEGEEDNKQSGDTEAMRQQYIQRVNDLGPESDDL
jgi:hypothetical protein